LQGIQGKFRESENILFRVWALNQNTKNSLTAGGNNP